MEIKEKNEEIFLSELVKKNIREKVSELSKYNLCENCIGRQFGMIGRGFNNKQRGKIVIDFSKNKFGVEFNKSGECYLCKDFFDKQIEKVVGNAEKKLKENEFETFLVGSVIPSNLAKREEEVWDKSGIEDVERLKTEINREVGKRIERTTKKKFDKTNPDILIVIDVENYSARLQLRSLFISGKYQKLARGIPQTKWPCYRCNGKGCTFCKGVGKLYKTSVQEIIEKPFFAATKGRNSKFHGGGREDIDARNLGWRPFVIEIEKPAKRKIDLKKIEKQLNKSKKVNVKGLKFSNKELVRTTKSERFDKTYSAEVEFENEIDKKKLKDIKSVIGQPILQRTPLRVAHRRADKVRKRMVKKISWKILGDKKLQIKVTGEAGLYIKELISGDEGRTKPNISEIINNKVKKINLDVLKIG